MTDVSLEGTGPPTATLASAAVGRSGRQLRSTIERYGLVFAWLVLIAGFGILQPHSFLSVANLSAVLGSQAVVAVLALGVLLPMTSGDFDLSVASVLTLSAMLTAVLNVHLHWPIVPALIAALLTGSGIGLFNGLLTTSLGIDPFIVTLGSGTFASGLVLWISDSNTISGVSSGLVQAVVGTRPLGIPLEFYYALVLCGAIWYLFEFTRAGRLLLFVGRGRTVARLSGIRVQRVRVLALTGSGLISALAGVLYLGTTGAADPTSGLQLLLPSFAAAFLGATAIRPGRFNPIGTLVAVYFLVTGITGLQMLGVQSYVQDLFYGGALVLAVSLSQLARRRQALDEETR